MASTTRGTRGTRGTRTFREAAKGKAKTSKKPRAVAVTRRKGSPHGKSHR